MKKILILFIFIPLIAFPQYVRLTDFKSKSTLYLDLDRLYNYNIYERNQLGLGLYFVTPTNNDKVPQWRIDAYAGYSTLPREWKYGGKVTLCFHKGWQWQPFVQYFEDFVPASSIYLNTYSLLNPSQNTGFMTSHMLRMRRAAIGTTFTPNHGILSFHVDFSYDREWCRYKGNDLLYPKIYPEDYITPQDFATLHLTATYKGMLTLDVSSFKEIASYDTPLSIKAILQYNKSYKYKNSTLNTFAQMGFVTQNTSYSHRFDISGTAGSYFFFDNSLHTLAPNSFTSDLYARFSTKLRLNKLIPDNRYCNPKPFVQVSGAAAYAYDDTWTALLEPCVGIDDILRYGAIIFGAAFAYRLSPKNASCYSPYFSDNSALMFTATLTL